MHPKSPVERTKGFPMSIVDLLRPMPNLRVLVTAGASGIGSVIARAFDEVGARVHVCDVDRAALDRLRKDSPSITGSMADASVEADVDLVFDDLRITLGGLDVLVNNASITGPSMPIERVDAAAWKRTMAVNLNSQYYFACRAVPLLKTSTAHPNLIAIGSPTAGLIGSFRAPYDATQWALIGLVKSLATELGSHGIRANAILPSSNEHMSACQPVEAADVAALALFLCSPAARNLTGQAIRFDELAQPLHPKTCQG
jgi:NAD(P)-dependent dehydrogenase (short-subunit alcohol dehydrogenase family)